MNCLLCQTRTQHFQEFRGRNYYLCQHCHSLQLDKQNFISLEDEKSRYEEHNNDVNDFGYQKFVTPLVKIVLENFKQDQQGLDFGAGTGPVLTKLLEESGYQIKKYDPFFWNDSSLLTQTYDYIVSCEVIEHFHNPYKEFDLLYKLLKKNGKLILKTDLYDDDIDFRGWYYKNDATHVFFYSEETFKWIKEQFKFKSLEIKDRVIILSK